MSKYVRVRWDENDRFYLGDHLVGYVTCDGVERGPRWYGYATSLGGGAYPEGSREAAMEAVERHYGVVTEETQMHTDEEFNKLQKAALALYEAGIWHCDRPVDEAALWINLRDALALPRGHGTSIGVGVVTEEQTCELN